MVSSNLVESYFVECSHVLHDCESSIKYIVYVHFGRLMHVWQGIGLTQFRQSVVCRLSGISELRLNGARQTYGYYRTLMLNKKV